jgi:hypothetical protein
MGKISLRIGIKIGIAIEMKNQLAMATNLLTERESGFNPNKNKFYACSDSKSIGSAGGD